MKPLLVNVAISVWFLLGGGGSFGHAGGPTWFEPPAGTILDDSCRAAMDVSRQLRQRWIGEGQIPMAQSFDNEMRKTWQIHQQHAAQDAVVRARDAAEREAATARERERHDRRARIATSAADPRIAGPAISLRICQRQDEQAEAKRQIKEAKAIARRGAGVVDLAELKQYQDNMAEAEAAERELRAQLRGLKKAPLACKSKAVQQLMMCFDEGETPSSEFCTDEALVPFLELVRSL